MRARKKKERKKREKADRRVPVRIYVAVPSKKKGKIKKEKKKAKKKKWYEVGWMYHVGRRMGPDSLAAWHPAYKVVQRGRYLSRKTR